MSKQLKAVIAPSLLRQLEDFGLKDRAKKAIQDAMQDPDLAGRQLVGDLYPYRRLKVGRYRIIYRVVPKKGEVRFVYCGLRKEGSKKDVYTSFAKFVQQQFEAQ